MEDVLISYTPGHAALGGLVLGVATVLQLLLNGQVLGISGAVRDTFGGAPGRDRAEAAVGAALVLGMVIVGFPASVIAPSAFDVFPHAYNIGRAAAGGFLVGLGSGIGNGCTSGHGICGSARLSLRSCIYVPLFIIVAFFSATLTKLQESLGVISQKPELEQVPDSTLIIALVLACGSALVGAAVVYLIRTNIPLAAVKPSLPRCGSSRCPPPRGPTPSLGRVPSLGRAQSLGPSMSGALNPAERVHPGVASADAEGSTRDAVRQVIRVAASLLIGALFAIGLTISGMTRPTKVGAFLSPLHEAWDPSLLCVMAVAVATAFPFYQIVVGRLGSKTPSWMLTPALIHYFQIPSITAVDVKLLSGGFLFGVGWGMTGLCPGPALVDLGANMGGPHILAYVMSMAVGLALEPYLGAAIDPVNERVMRLFSRQSSRVSDDGEGASRAGSLNSSVTSQGLQKLQAGNGAVKQPPAGALIIDVAGKQESTAA